MEYDNRHLIVILKHNWVTSCKPEIFESELGYPSFILRCIFSTAWPHNPTHRLYQLETRVARQMSVQQLPDLLSNVCSHTAALWENTQWRNHDGRDTPSSTPLLSFCHVLPLHLHLCLHFNIVKMYACSPALHKCSFSKWLMNICHSGGSQCYLYQTLDVLFVIVLSDLRTSMSYNYYYTLHRWMQECTCTLQMSALTLALLHWQRQCLILSSCDPSHTPLLSILHPLTFHIVTHLVSSILVYCLFPSSPPSSLNVVVLTLATDYGIRRLSTFFPAADGAIMTAVS